MKMLNLVLLLVLIFGISVAGVCFAQSDFSSSSFTTGKWSSVGNVPNMAGFRLPAVNTDALQAGVSTSLTAGHQKYVEVAPPDGASFMVSSVPVVIQTQASKNIFTANIPNDKGGFSTVIIQKVGDRFIGLPGVVMENGL